MKKMWNMLRGKVRRDNRGMSFVEVLCAVAILGLVSGVIGTVIVMSTRTYKKGISETGIQQEAQLAANNIGNLVKDACSVRYALAGAQYLENGETYMVKADGVSELINETGFTDLSIITNDKVQYTITYDDANSVLWYAEYDVGAPSPRRPVEIMANNITAFSADTKDFKKSKTIKLNMTVYDPSTDREIPMEYTMTSRNDAMDGFEYVASTFSVVIAFPDTEVVLVPGETYEIPLIVSGTLSEGLEWESTGALTGGALTTDYAEVTVPKDIAPSVSYEMIKVHTKDKNADGTPKSSATCKVLIRRVTKVDVTHVVDTAHADGHMLEAAGAEYTFSATVAGYELAKRPAYGFDNNYKTAQAVVWSCVFDLNGAETAYDWTVSQDPASGIWMFAQPNFGTEPFSDYFEVLENKEDEIFPSFKIKLKKAMPANFSLTVRATSKHALGVNKADSDYGDKNNTYYYGEDTIGPRPTKLNQDLEITLEPYETGSVKLGMKGGIGVISDNSYVYRDATNLCSTVPATPAEWEWTEEAYKNAAGTRVMYDEGNDEIVITLGKDEMGSGPSGAKPYTFEIDITAGGTTTTIKVHVRRIDKIWVGVVQDEVPKTYDFRARINVAKGMPNNQNTTKYLYDVIKDNPDDATAKKIVAQTLSSKITWEFYDYSKSKTKPQYSDWVICDGEIQTKGTGSKTTSEGFTANREYYKLTKSLKDSVKPARIQIYTQAEFNEDSAKGDSRASEVKVGDWYIRQYPEVDLTLTKGSLPANTELRVTIEMLHPQGSNKSGFKYNDRKEWEVYASASIYGNRIYTDSEIVVVEPGQGTDSYKQSDEEIVIPIHSEGEDQDDKIVARMEATVDSKYKTRKSIYPDNTPNPYCQTERTSKGTSEWLLGLVIDKDAQGDSNGLIPVKVEAYDAENTLLTEMNFQLAVRRVNSVDVEETNGNSELSDINIVGNTVTLEAYSKGKGKDGTAYYGVQTKDYTEDTMGFDITINENDSRLDDRTNDSKICRWERIEHGRYRSPIKMDWTLTCDGSTTSVKNSTYLSNVKIEEKFEKKVKDGKEVLLAKSVLTFTLAKELPSNAKFRATSLHALGKVEGSSTKYNKAGAKYDDVSGVWPSGLITVSGGWKRGGVLDIAYNIPPENITYVDGKPFLVKDGQTLWDGAIATKISFKSKYNGANQQDNHLFQSPSYFTHNPYDNGKGVGGERGEAYFEGKTLTEYTATIYAWGDRLENISYSSPYTKGDGAYIDLSTIEMKVNVGTTNVDATNTIAVEERTFEIPDVVFQYQNSLPDTSKQKGDSDGAWTNKNDEESKNQNTLKVYVTPDDTISSYKSYYKLSEGWEETYEKYTLLTSRYVGVINDEEDDSRDERLFDFTVTNTTGEGNEEGRSYVEFKFTKNVRTQNKGKVVKMIYEYNPYLCNTDNNSSAPYAWAYGLYEKKQLDEIDGCEGILEFHFVDANIKAKSGVTMPEVRYCPTYSENKSSATPNYYYISDTARFHIDSNGTDAQYQTGSAGKWTKKCSMKYANGMWTIQ